MIRHDVLQGSEAWEQVRLGIPTASCFHKIVTPKTLKLSDQRHAYRNKLLAEWLLGMPTDNEFVTEAMERGSQMEHRALAWYEAMRDVSVDRVGFCTTDDGMIGCSPDGLVGEDGGLELKSPMAPKCVGYLLGDKIAQDHWMQVQGGIFVTGRAWWDVLAWNPYLSQFPAEIVRVEAHEQTQAALRLGLELFIHELTAAREHLLAKGCVPRGVSQ